MIWIVWLSGITSAAASPTLEVRALPHAVADPSGAHVLEARVAERGTADFRGIECAGTTDVGGARHRVSFRGDAFGTAPLDTFLSGPVVDERWLFAAQKIQLECHSTEYSPPHRTLTWSGVVSWHAAPVRAGRDVAVSSLAIVAVGDVGDVLSPTRVLVRVAANAPLAPPAKDVVRCVRVGALSEQVGSLGFDTTVTASAEAEVSGDVVEVALAAFPLAGRLSCGLRAPRATFDGDPRNDLVTVDVPAAPSRDAPVTLGAIAPVGTATTVCAQCDHPSMGVPGRQLLLDVRAQPGAWFALRCASSDGAAVLHGMTPLPLTSPHTGPFLVMQPGESSSFGMFQGRRGGTFHLTCTTHRLPDGTQLASMSAVVTFRER